MQRDSGSTLGNSVKATSRFYQETPFLFYLTGSRGTTCNPLVNRPSPPTFPISSGSRLDYILRTTTSLSSAVLLSQLTHPKLLLKATHTAPQQLHASSFEPRSTSNPPSRRYSEGAAVECYRTIIYQTSKLVEHPLEATESFHHCRTGLEDCFNNWPDYIISNPGTTIDPTTCPRPVIVGGLSSRIKNQKAITTIFICTRTVEVKTRTSMVQ